MTLPGKIVSGQWKTKCRHKNRNMSHHKGQKTLQRQIQKMRETFWYRNYTRHRCSQTNKRKPLQQRPFRPKMAKPPKWHSLFNHTLGYSIRRTFQKHYHADTKPLKGTTITCRKFQIGKITRASHRQITHNVPVWMVIAKDVAGTIHPLGINGEKYLIKFTYIGSRFTIVIPFTTRSHITHSITEVLTYAKHNPRPSPGIDTLWKW